MMHCRATSKGAAVRRPTRRLSMSPATLLVAFTLGFSNSATAQQSSQTGAASDRRTRTAAADAAYAAGDKAEAEREYAAVLQAAPDDSRAIYMLAQLRRDRVREAVALLGRYVRLEPADAWGHIALGDALGRAGRVSDASAEFDAAERLAPDERDVRLGRGRMLARVGRTDSAIVVYERWLKSHARDAEAERELARQYRRAGRDRSAIATLEQAQRVAPDERTAQQLVALRAGVAPRVEPEVGGSRDSDGNGVWRVGAIAGFTVADAVDLTIGGGTRRASDALSMAQLGDARLGVAWRPRATVRLDVAGSFVGVPGDTTTTTVPIPGPGPGPGQGRGNPRSSNPVRFEPTGRLRFIWQDAASRARIDLRATRTILDASPLLVFNDVVRSEIGGEANVRIIGPLALRGAARAATISSTVDDNSRTLLAGRVVAAIPSGGEITVGVQEIAYDHASTAGYFAPRFTRVAEVGVYRELETEGGVTAAIDLGAGGQQVGEWDAAVSKWSPSARGWASLGIPLAPGRELRFEMEAYEAKVGNEVATSAARWRYVSASVGLRWSLR